VLPTDTEFGEALVRHGHATEEDLEEARDLQIFVKRHLERRPSFAEIFLIRGTLTTDQLRTIVHELGVPHDVTTRVSGRALFGRIAVERGYVTPDQLLHCLGLQQEDAIGGKKPRPLGAILGGEGFISPLQLKKVLQIQHSMAAEQEREKQAQKR